MDIPTIFNDAVFRSKKIENETRIFGLVVDVNNEETIICYPDGKLETDQIFEIGTWLSFQISSENDIKKLEDIQIEDAKMFPGTIVHNGVVNVISKAAAPNSNYSLNKIGRSWKYLAWSTEWNVVGDPKMLFATFSKDKIFNVRMIYNPGQTRVAPSKNNELPQRDPTSYNWQIVDIIHCFDRESLYQIIRAPWNIGIQQLKVDEKNREKQLGFIYKKKFIANSEQDLLYLSTTKGQCVKVRGSSNYVPCAAKIGDWVYYDTNIELGSNKDRAFIMENIERIPGKVIEIKDNNDKNDKNDKNDRKYKNDKKDKISEYIIDFNFIYDDSIKKALLEKSKTYQLQYGKFLIDITVDNLNTELLRCKQFKKNINFLQPTDLIEAKARFVKSPTEGCHVWAIYEICYVLKQT